MSETPKTEAVLTVQHNKNMYEIGTASVDPEKLKKAGVAVPDGMELVEVIGVNFTFKTKEK